jgi:hypothetical protein
VPTDDPTTQPTSDVSAADRTSGPQYEIRVDGHLGSRWVAWFDGLNLINEDDGTTVISGPVVDQAALHGLLTKLRDLGVPLVSVIQLSPGEPTEVPNLSHTRSSHNPSGATS